MVEINVRELYTNTVPQELLNSIKQFLTNNLDVVIDKIAGAIIIKTLKNNDTHRNLIRRAAATLVTGIGIIKCNVYYAPSFAPGFSPAEYKPIFVFVEDDDIVISIKNKIGHITHMCGYLFEHDVNYVSKDKAEDYLAIYSLLKTRVHKLLGEENE